MSRLWIWRTLVTGLGVLLLAVGLHTIARFLPARVSGNDFVMAYLAARALAQGLDPYTLSLDDYARQQGVPAPDIIPQATNPPLLLWMLRPLSLLSPATAFWLYVGIEALALTVVIAVSMWLLGWQLSPAGWCLAVGLMSCSMPIFAHFWFSQVQLQLLALVMVGAWALRARRSWLAIVLFTLAAALKLYPAPIALWPALTAKGWRRWNLLTWTFLAGLGWAAIPGWTLWESFRQHGLPLVLEMVNGKYYNFTVSSVVVGLLGGTTLARLVATACSAALTVAALWKCSRRQPDSDESLCLLLVATVMCSSVAWVHYFVWLFYPLCVVAAQVRSKTGPLRGWRMLLLVLSLIGFSSPFMFSNPAARPFNASVPLLLMALLYVHYYREPRSRG
jgi:hypothetical protein